MNPPNLSCRYTDEISFFPLISCWHHKTGGRDMRGGAKASNRFLGPPVTLPPTHHYRLQMWWLTGSPTDLESAVPGSDPAVKCCTKIPEQTEEVLGIKNIYF